MIKFSTKTITLIFCSLLFAGNANAGLFDIGVDLETTIDLNNSDLDVIIAAYDRLPDHVIKVISRAEVVGGNLIEKAGDEITRNLSYASCLNKGVLVDVEASLSRLLGQIPFTNGVAECGPYSVRENLSPNPYELFEYELCRINEIYEKDDFEGNEVVTKLGNTDSAISIASCWVESSPEMPELRKKILTEKKSKYQPVFIAWDFADRDCIGIEKCATSSIKNAIAKMEAYPDELPLKSVVISQSSNLLPKPCRGFFRFICSSTNTEEWEEKMNAAARGFSLLKMEYEKTGVEEMKRISEEVEVLIESAKSAYGKSLDFPLVGESRVKFINDVTEAKKMIDRLNPADSYFNAELGKFPNLENYRLKSVAIYDEEKAKFQNDLFKVKRTSIGARWVRRGIGEIGGFDSIIDDDRRYRVYDISCRFRDGQSKNYTGRRVQNCPSASQSVKAELRQNLLDPFD